MQERPFDKEFFLNAGELTKPFVSSQEIYDKVMLDFNAKTREGIKITKLDSLMSYIHKYISSSDDKEFIYDNKFQRTAKEIFCSGVSTGCTDYAVVFCTFARQLGLPTTLLHTADVGWLRSLKQGQSRKHFGHSFCECYYGDRWLLIDPTSRKIIVDYDPNFISLPYYVGTSCQFIAYMRCLDLKKQSIKEHNDMMDKLCFNLEIKM